jgi:DNA polymerase-1
MGLKGGREQIASVKPYQERRSGARTPELQQRILDLRTHLANYETEHIKPVPNLYQEADDSLTQYHMLHSQKGKDMSILMSGDKDLWMVPGTHADPKTGEFYTVIGYGQTKHKDVGLKDPKLVGRGTSWFWHQMLMGDGADNIPGLPMLSGRLANRYVPTKTYNPRRKSIKCGEAKAVAILKDVSNEVEAARRVYECYRDHWGSLANEMFFEQGFLLWMRRVPDVLDVIHYFAECNLMITPSKKQVERLGHYKELVKLQKAQSQEEL